MRTQKEEPFAPGRADRFTGKAGDMQCTGSMPVQPWIGRDGLVYPERLRGIVKPEDVKKIEDMNED